MTEGLANNLHVLSSSSELDEQTASLLDAVDTISEVSDWIGWGVDKDLSQRLLKVIGRLSIVALHLSGDEASR